MDDQFVEESPRIIKGDLAFHENLPLSFDCSPIDSSRGNMLKYAVAPKNNGEIWGELNAKGPQIAAPLHSYSINLNNLKNVSENIETSPRTLN